MHTNDHHAHGHHHGEGAHNHAEHAHPAHGHAPAQPRSARRPGFSLLAQSAPARLAGAGVIVIALWLVSFWAMA